MTKIDEITVSIEEVVSYIRLTGKFGPELRDLVRRKIIREGAVNSGLKVTGGELQQAADDFRNANDLHSSKATENWFKSNGVSIEAFEEFIETNLLITKFKDELMKKADKEKYYSSKGIQSWIRDMIFEEWVEQEMK